MENKDKYYTPTIEEFHVGFEYEYLGRKDNHNWEIITADWENLNILFDDYEHEMDGKFSELYRVKYLNKEDIESFGFKYGSDDMYDILDYKCEKNYYDQLHLVKRGVWILISIGRKDQNISEFATIFAGIIKNKSEFTKLLKQLQLNISNLK